MDYTNEEFDFENRIMTTSYIGGDDSDSDTSLRPKTLDDYIANYCSYGAKNFLIKKVK